MQTDPNQGSRGKDTNTHHLTHNKDFYNYSVLKPNALNELCYEISNTEVLDFNVEKVINRE
jgi:hypothetical protein